jgi:hypothetical protein
MLKCCFRSCRHAALCRAFLALMLAISCWACSPNPTGTPPGTGGTGSPPDAGPSNFAPLSAERCALFTTLAGETGNVDCPSGTYQGSIRVDSPEDLAKLSGCRRIAGQLLIDVSGSESLAGLESLSVVEGSIHLYSGGCSRFGCTSRLTNTDALSHLACVGGDFRIQGSALGTARYHFDGLTEVQGSLGIPALANVDPLRALRRVWGDVSGPSFAQVPALTQVYGYFFDPVAAALGQQVPSAPSAVPRGTYVGCGGGALPCRDGVLGCSYSASNQTELDRLSACEYATQDVSVSGAGIANLQALQKLRKVRSAFKLQGTSLVGLRGLENLDQVYGLVLVDNASLTDVSALDGLAVGAISLIGNASLTSLDSWKSLRVRVEPPPVPSVPPEAKFGFVLELKNNAKLVTIGDWPWLTAAQFITISDSPVTELRGLRKVVSAETVTLSNLTASVELDILGSLQKVLQLHVVNAPKLTKLPALNGLETAGLMELSALGVSDLSGLSRLTRVEQFYISDLPALKALSGLSSFKSVSSLQLSKLPALKNLIGLESLEQLSKLSINDCDQLLNLEGLKSVRFVDTVELTRLKSLTSLQGFATLRAIFFLNLSELSALPSLAGLPQLELFSLLSVKKCSALTSLRGLDGRTYIQSIELEGNGALRGLAGLEALEEAGALRLRNNQALASLRALTNLRSVSSLDIQGNSHLPDCEVRWLVNQLGTPELGLDWINGGSGTCQTAQSP